MENCQCFVPVLIHFFIGITDAAGSDHLRNDVSDLFSIPVMVFYNIYQLPPEGFTDIV